MKIKIEYDLENEEDLNEYQQFTTWFKNRVKLYNIDSELRSINKYDQKTYDGKPFETKEDLIDFIREDLHTFVYED